MLGAQRRERLQRASGSFKRGRFLLEAVDRSRQGGGQEARIVSQGCSKNKIPAPSEIFAASIGFLGLKTVFDYVTNFSHACVLGVHSLFPFVFSKMLQNVSPPPLC